MGLNLTGYSLAKEITIFWTLCSPFYLEYFRIGVSVLPLSKVDRSWLTPLKGKGTRRKFRCFLLSACSVPCSDLNRLSPPPRNLDTAKAFESHWAWTICPPWSAAYLQRNTVVTIVNVRHEQQHHPLSVCGIRSVLSSSI